jgi:multicomponent Na+:H+ antiporter subunit C
MELLGHVHYWVFAILLMTGFYAIIVKHNLIKKLLGLTIFQSAVFLLYIATAGIENGTAPIIRNGNPDQLYSNPLPQVLILTAIVVGIATTALGLAIVIRIREAYDSIEDDVIRRRDRRR